MEIISWPFGWIMHFIYSVVKNYGIALIFFTLFTKIMLFPLAIKQQKNQARMQLLNPKLNKIKKKYANNKTKLNEETMNLYAEENVNPTSGCLPLLVQLPILYGLYNVITKPLTYLLRLKSDVIKDATDFLVNNKDKFDFLASKSAKIIEGRSEVYLVNAYQSNPEIFAQNNIDGLDSLKHFDYSFLGIDLGGIPSFTTILIIIPIISFIVNIILTIYTQHKTKKANAGMAQLGAGMNMFMYTMPIMSAIFTFSVPAGVGFYWILSTIFSLFQTMLLYKLYTPERVAAQIAKNPKKPAKKSFFQKALEAQQQQQGNVSNNQENDTSDVKLSNSALKDLQRQRLAEARRRMAEKYGDDYNEGADK